MMDFDQQQITAFFEKDLHHHNARSRYMQNFTRSGYALVDRIPREAHILDVGCGQNLFKPYFPNLIGIDVIGTACDHQTSLLEYRNQYQFDVILCLGSIFGSLNDIKTQIHHMKSMLIPHGKIYWRNHPADPRFNPPGMAYPPWFYAWTEQTHIQLTAEMGFVLNEVCKDYIQRDGQVTEVFRIYAEWTMA